MRLPLTEATTDSGDPPAGHRVCGARWGFLFSEGVDHLYPTEDYAANDRTYAIKVDASQGLTLSQTSARLHPGQSFDLSVNNNTGSTAPITRTSSNPEVGHGG